MAYTYLIGWSSLNKYYYGSRYARNCVPEDLWVTYFTSSKEVKSFREQNGDPDIIEIRKIFDDSNLARAWEERVLRRLRVCTNERWLNKTINCRSIPLTLSTRFGQDNGMFGRKHRPDSIDKMREWRPSEETKRKMRGRRPAVNQTGAKNNAFKGYIYTPHGRFESLRSAAEAEPIKTDLSTISYRIISKSRQFTQYRRESM